MQDYNTIIGAIQMRLNKCPTRSVMDRFRIGSSTLICFKNPPMRIVKIITMNPLCSQSLNDIFCSSAFSFNCNHTLFQIGRAHV